MSLPLHIESEAALEDVLAEPSEADVACAARIGGHAPDVLDVIIIGAGGKMGPSLARRVRRAMTLAGVRGSLHAASRFSDGSVRRSLDAGGVVTHACDLLDPASVSALPRCGHVLFLAGRKFGTVDRTDLTWATNTIVPAQIAERFHDSRIVVFSTGNVYPLVPISSGGATEDDRPDPVGEYAQSCLGRERVAEYVSRSRGTPMLMLRLNYAVDLRYGVLVDIARRVYAGEAIDLTMGYFNAIWQGDANSYALRSLELCASPPAILNVTGPERISVREAALWFGSAFGRAPRFVNDEGAVALLSDSSRCRARLGEPAVSLDCLKTWVAHWVRSGGPSLGKPTHFEATDGRF
jgi:dTDP-4-dehydrorhamnose reductase